MQRTRLRRGPLLDWYVDGARSAVFVDDQVVVLSELGTAVVDLVGGDGCSVAELTDALEDRFGRPERASLAAAVDDVVALLEERGIVVSEEA